MSKLIWKMDDDSYDSISSFSLLRLNVQEKKSHYYLDEDGYVKCLRNAVTFLPMKYSNITKYYLFLTHNTLSTRSLHSTLYAITCLQISH